MVEVDMIYDMLSFMLSGQQFNSIQHLASKQAGVNPVYDYWEQSWLWLIKGVNGFPYDIDSYDKQYVYQNYTEGPSGWTDFTSYKQFASKTFPNGNGGIGWSYRYLDTANPPGPLQSDSTYNTYQGGKQVNTTPENLGGDTITQVKLPSIMTIGSLTNILVVELDYFWGSTLEKHFYGLGLSMVQWENWTSVNGVYVLQTQNIFDQVTIGGGVKPKTNIVLP
jgi:hypothetical protein